MSPWSSATLTTLWSFNRKSCEKKKFPIRPSCFQLLIPLFHQISCRAGLGPVLCLEPGFLFPLTKNWLWASKKKKNSSRVAPALCWARGKNCLRQQGGGVVKTNNNSKTARGRHFQISNEIIWIAVTCLPSDMVHRWSPGETGGCYADQARVWPTTERDGCGGVRTYSRADQQQIKET